MKYFKMKISFFLFILLAVGLLFWYIYLPKSAVKNKNKKVPLVSVSRVAKRNIKEILELTGETVVINRVTIKTTVTGIISYCPWREGDSIKKEGETLIKIDRPLFMAEMEAKQATLEVAKAKLADLKAGTRPEEILRAQHDVNRLKECEAYTKKDLKRNINLGQRGVVSKESVEIARVSYTKCSSDLKSAQERVKMLKKGATKTQIAVLQAQVKEAEAEFKISREKVLECQISAPFPGLISKVFIHKGALVRENDNMLEMMNPDSMVIRFHVPEQYAHLIRKNTSVSVLVDSFKGEYVDSKIVRIFPEIDEATHTVTVESSLNIAGVSPGMFIRVKLPVRSAKNALIVPDAALLTDQNGKHSIFVLKDGKAEKRIVKKGLESGFLVQIVKGVSFGETVIIAGNNNLKNDVQVKVKKKSRPSLPKSIKKSKK